MVASHPNQPIAVAGNQQLGRIGEDVGERLLGVAEAKGNALDTGYLGVIGLVRRPDR